MANENPADEDGRTPGAPGESPQCFTGSCLCGAMRFRIRGPLAPIQICHCTQCRKAQGAPFATNIAVPRDAFQWEDGLALLRHYESTPGKFRYFCGNCGSPLFSARAALPDRLRVRAGLLDGPLPVRPQSHAYVDSQANWWPDVGDGLPRYPQARPG
jgi:hypothetical protein